MRAFVFMVLLLGAALLCWWIPAVVEQPREHAAELGAAFDGSASPASAPRTHAQTQRAASAPENHPDASSIEADALDDAGTLGSASGEAFLVHVRDDQDQAATRVPLTLVWMDRQYRFARSMWNGNTDASGICRIERGTWWRPNQIYWIAVARPFFAEPALELAVGEWPLEDQQLVLPREARWILRVIDEQDRPVTTECILHLVRAAEEAAANKPWVRQELTQLRRGDLVDPVAIPAACALNAYVEDPSGEHYPGTVIRLPHLRAGEERSEQLRLGSAKAWAKLRLMDEEGEAFASAEVLVWCGRTANTWNTNASGELLVRLDEPYQPGKPRTLRILGFQDRSYFPRRGPAWNLEHQDLKVEIDLSYELGSGEHDLGTFTLQRAPAILDGKVVSEDGSAVPFAAVEIYYAVDSKEDETPDQRDWTWLTALDCDERGKFALRSNIEAKYFRIQAARADLIGAAPTDCTRFDRNLVLYLVHAAKLEGRVALPPDTNPRAVYFELELPAPVSEGQTAPPSSTAWIVEPYSNYFTLEADGSFKFDAAPPGRARLRLLASADDRVLAEMELDLHPGESCTDPRLVHVQCR